MVDGCVSLQNLAVVHSHPLPSFDGRPDLDMAPSVALRGAATCSLWNVYAALYCVLSQNSAKWSTVEIGRVPELTHITFCINKRVWALHSQWEATTYLGTTSNVCFSGRPQLLTFLEG